MRRKEREVTDARAIEKILKEGQVCHLGMMGEELPYIVPLNYGYCWEKGEMTLYFHCASKGKKLDLIKRHPKVAFSIAVPRELITGPCACDYTMAYGSILGQGRIEIVEDAEEKVKILHAFMEKFQGGELPLAEKSLRAVTVLKLTVESFTSKQSPNP